MTSAFLLTESLNFQLVGAFLWGIGDADEDLILGELSVMAEDIFGICWNQTSVNCGVWETERREWNEEWDDWEYQDFDITKDAGTFKHTLLFDRYDEFWKAQ